MKIIVLESLKRIKHGLIMNKGLWIARKNYLFCIIKKLSDGSGGDDTELLKGHCMEVLELYPGELIEEAISCYEELVSKLHYQSRSVKK